MAPIVAALSVVVVGFIVATVYMELRASAIDADAEQIEVNALPSVEHLAAARASLFQLELASIEYADEPDARATAAAGMDEARRRANLELAEAFATDTYPGESELEAGAMHALGDLDGLLDHLRELARRDDGATRAFRRQDVHRGFERADAAIERMLSLNGTQGHAEAIRIAAVRAGSVRLALGLNLACIALSAVTAMFAVRSVRRQRRLEEAHEEILETRAAELERFAARVAHDLLSPLSALHFTLSSLERNAEKGLPIAEPIERARACLKRSQSLVNGVMDFARSGAAPTGGRAHVRSTLDGVVEEARAEAGAIEISIQGVDDDLFVACSNGVLSSILSNLVRNAVKYVDDKADKRITVRASAKGSNVRVEVEDTGAGLPPGLEDHVFEPYVRSPDNPKPGLGLGLATVQRFVESHRGRVGVASSAGQGSLFWFEMPRAAGVSAR